MGLLRCPDPCDPRHMDLISQAAWGSMLWVHHGLVNFLLVD